MQSGSESEIEYIYITKATIINRYIVKLNLQENEIESEREREREREGERVPEWEL